MAVLFDDGSTEYLSVATSPCNNWPVSASAWVRSDSSAGYQTVFGLYDASSTTDWWRLLLGGDVAGDPVYMQALRTGGSNVTATTTTGYSANTWHHIAGTLYAVDIKVYGEIWIDGGSYGADDQNALGNPELWDLTRIGYTGDSTPVHPFSGRIAQVALWNARLSAAEVALLAKGFSPLFFQPKNLIGYWPLGSINDIEDRIGTQHMVAYNTPTSADDPLKIMYPDPVLIRNLAPDLPIGSLGRAMPNEYKRMRVWPVVVPVAVGQPMGLRSTTVPGTRQWQPQFPR